MEKYQQSLKGLNNKLLKLYDSSDIKTLINNYLNFELYDELNNFQIDL